MIISLQRAHPHHTHTHTPLQNNTTSSLSLSLCFNASSSGVARPLSMGARAASPFVLQVRDPHFLLLVPRPAAASITSHGYVSNNRCEAAAASIHKAHQ